MDTSNPRTFNGSPHLPQVQTGRRVSLFAYLLLIYCVGSANLMTYFKLLLCFDNFVAIQLYSYYTKNIFDYLIFETYYTKNIFEYLIFEIYYTKNIFNCR